MSKLLPIERPNGNYFAIQLKETRFKKNFDLKAVSEIIFNWNSVAENINLSNSDLIIKVAQTNPDLDSDQIKNLVKEIQETKKIRPLDRIFGLKDKSIIKIGYVDKKEIVDESIVKVSVNWINDSAFPLSGIPIFDDNKEIQVLKSTDLNKIEKQFGESLQIIYDQMPIIEGNTNYFETNYKTIQELDYEIGLLPKEEQGGKITLFYGTNRNALEIIKEKQNYGNDLNELAYGLCDVSIPRGHIQGELERPMRIIWSFPELESSHIVVKKVLPMDYSTFLEKFDSIIKTTPEKNALLFVHGYNNSFEDAARRTAQLAWDLPFDGFSGFFSWPSSADMRDYLSDEAKARSSFPALELFLKQLMLNTELEHIHIIAHSMGTIVTTLSLNSLRRDASITEHLVKIQQLILGASDIDQEEFRNTILPEFKNIGIRRTIYTSDKDFALGMSSWGRRGRLRLGQSGKDIFVDQHLDTVETSNIDVRDLHGYIFESKLLLNDLFMLITHNLSPSQRRLREIKKSLLRYWLFLE